ncbi:mRNA-processing endoribonuclease [Sporobolomyces koalae]|uniref:mRNA-processing endoribonuclease n=1 Tax=Sporobolomyces koalae TaxID=500713 RepID=UPI003170A1DF
MDWEQVVPNSQDVLAAVRTLRDGDGLADMQIDLPLEFSTGARRTNEGLIVVVDTNILISHLPLLRSFVELCDRLASSSERPTLLVPHIVLRELDGLKSSAKSVDVAPHVTNSSRGRRMNASIASLARAATNWLLSAISPPSSTNPKTTPPSIVRGQRKSETLFSQHASPAGENNDSLVLDAAAFFAAQHKRVVLLSDDNNLRLRAKFEIVDALGIDDRIGANPDKLLATLDPSHRAASPPSSPVVMSPPAASSTKTPDVASKTVRSSRSPPLSPSPRSPPRAKAIPIPLPSTVARSSSMMLDSSFEIPLHPSPHAPALLPSTTRTAIFSNLLVLFAHFVALPIYKTIYTRFECLPDRQTAEQTRVLEELQDWRAWDATTCLQVIRKWWNDGGLRELCERGYDALYPSSPVPSPLASSPPRSPPKPTSSKPVRPSRWAVPADSSSQSPNNPRSPRSSRFAISSPGSTSLQTLNRPRPTSSNTALSSLYSTLPSLIATFSLEQQEHDMRNAEISKWSAIRFEILLESLGNWLLVLLSGYLKTNLTKDIHDLVRGWERELRLVGVEVGTVNLGL